MENLELNGKSLNIKEGKVEMIKKAFPEVFTEGKINWEKLKKTLSENVETESERYGLNWAGKSGVFAEIAKQTTKTLKPLKDESVDFEKTQNIFVEGENLEVLKVLQKSFYGKVKMIYIDPPYNTGGDFVYKDKFSSTEEEYLQSTGDVDDDGILMRDYKKNAKENGKYHSNWLNMMYPRLYLAKNLMKEDGVIFVSIDDNEVANLRLVMDEIFGEENFIGCAARVSKKSNNKGDFWAPNFDYVLTYTKNREEAMPFFGGANYEAYDQIETEGKRKGEKYQLVRLYMSTIQNRNPEQRFFIECPDGSRVIPPGSTLPPVRPVLGDGIWRWSRKKFEEDHDRIVVKKVKSSNLIDENGNPAKWNVFTKTYLNDVINNASAKPNSLIENHINQIGSHELNKLEIPFDYSKPSTLIKFLAEISRTKKDDIILDFFVGSGTTAHAIMELNKEDGEDRKFIVIQIPEKTDEKSEAFSAGYKNIADIAKERIRRVSKKIKKEKSDTKTDLGMKVFKLDQSNFRLWRMQEFENVESLQQRLEDAIDISKKSSEKENMLFELLLKSGMDLNSKIENKGGFYRIGDGELIICLSDKIEQKDVDMIIDEKPSVFICLDSSFSGNDELKTNTALQMKSKNIEIKVI